MASSAKQAKKEFDRQMKMMRQQQDREHAWSEQQAQKQMDFQERMSSTAHQRQMQDLQAAGLNPILAAGSGGASTPAGAEPSYSSSIVDAMPQMFATLNQAIQAARQSSAHSARVASRAISYVKGSPNDPNDPDSKDSAYHKKNMDNALETYERVTSPQQTEYKPPAEVYKPGQGYVSTRSEVQRSIDRMRSEGHQLARQLQRDLGVIRFSISASIRGDNVNARAGIFGNLKQLGIVYQDLWKLRNNTYGNAGRVVGAVAKSIGRSAAGAMRSVSAKSRGVYLRQLQDEIDYARHLVGR